MRRDIQPMHDRVLVGRMPAETKHGLIIIPDTAQTHARYAKVLAVGPGRWIDGEFVRTSVKKGDVVLVPGAGNDFPDWEQQDTILIQEADIGAVIG